MRMEVYHDAVDTLMAPGSSSTEAIREAALLFLSRGQRRSSHDEIGETGATSHTEAVMFDEKATVQKSRTAPN